MIQRFTIEDLVAQNKAGVFYRAVDKTTDQTVGIRRFFPFGHDGGGLGAWLKWLRQASDTTNLHQAREMLSAAIGVEPPPSPTRLIREATVPDRDLKRGSKNGPSRVWLMIFFTLLLLIALGLAWWLNQRSHANASVMSHPMEAQVIR